MTEEIEPTQDERRWVQIDEGDGSWHLIESTSLNDDAVPTVTTLCGIETTSQLFLDRLPGGDGDNELIDPDCAAAAGITLPADEAEEPPKRSSTKSK